MSWIDKVKEKMRIRTADGNLYSPDWLNASLDVEYKHTEFNFVEVTGALVKRKKAIGNKFRIELYFQGLDHLDTARRFRASCDNTEGPWTIEHPLYSIINVQPTSLNYDNSTLAYSKITGVVIETMEESPGVFVLDPKDQVLILTEQNRELAGDSLTVTPGPREINNMTNTNNLAYNKGVPIIPQDMPEAFEELNNAYNTAATYINTATATPLLAMTSLITVLQMPAKFEIEVRTRINSLVDTFNTLRDTITGLTGVGSKQVFTAQQTSLVAAICQAAATPITGDYRRSSQVLEVLEQISEIYALLVEDLDSLQTDSANSPESFVGDAQMLISLNQLVNMTISSLFSIALGAQSERSIICEKNTNAIELTHLLYGLDSADNNVNELIENNDLAAWEYLQIEKGRKIVYYV